MRNTLLCALITFITLGFAVEAHLSGFTSLTRDDDKRFRLRVEGGLRKKFKNSEQAARHTQQTREKLAGETDQYLQRVSKAFDTALASSKNKIGPFDPKIKMFWDRQSEEQRKLEGTKTVPAEAPFAKEFVLHDRKNNTMPHKTKLHGATIVIVFTKSVTWNHLYEIQQGLIDELKLSKGRSEQAEKTN